MNARIWANFSHAITELTKVDRYVIMGVYYFLIGAKEANQKTIEAITQAVQQTRIIPGNDSLSLLPPYVLPIVAALPELLPSA